MTEELIILYRLDNQGGVFTNWHRPPGAKAHPIMINEAQCVLCSLETTTLTGLFITAKLLADVAVFKCRAAQRPVLVCHICCDYCAAH